MSLHIQTDWLPVVGRVVEIRLHGLAVRTGTVDAVTRDNSILWLAAEGAYPRVLLERSAGYTLWIRYEWEKQTSQNAMAASSLEPSRTETTIAPVQKSAMACRRT
jgi:hypothetical protein